MYNLTKSDIKSVEGITKEELSEILRVFNQFSNTYFWSPPKSATQRRTMRKTHDYEWLFTVNGCIPVRVRLKVDPSRNHVYVIKELFIGDVLKRRYMCYFEHMYKLLGGEI